MDLNKAEASQLETVSAAGIAEDEERNGVKGFVAQQVPRLDKRGLPLIPQPSDHKDDPLVRTPRLLLFRSPTIWG